MSATSGRRSLSGEGRVVCSRCRHCLAGQRHLCANTVGLGVGRDGAFAECLDVPMTKVWHHWQGIDHEAAFAAARSGDSGKVIMDWQS
jgi:D-arabinose 1-dehydrogenase-like Zn-dependent alcohol dehydrogenase